VAKARKSPNAQKANRGPANPAAPAAAPRPATPRTAPRRRRASSNSGSDLEWLRYAALAIISVIIWCTVYDRWSPEHWSVPVEYGWKGESSDVVGNLAGFKSAMDGHFWPMIFHNNPQLGAPYSANWNDYPATEDFLFWATGVLAKVIGLFAAANFAVMTLQTLAVLAFYYAARRLKCDWGWSAAGGLLFGMAPFAFAHSLHHFVVTAYGHVALGALVCFWVSNGRGLRIGTRDYWIAIGIAAATGCLNVYYASIFIQMVGIGLIIQWLRHGWRAAIPPFTIGCTAFAAFLVMDLHTVLYGLIHGHNPTALLRNYPQMELYAMKLEDFFMPFPTHRIPMLADIGKKFYSLTSLKAEEPPACYFGFAGIAAFLWLAVVTVRNAIARDRKRVPFEAVLVLWTLLYATVGGINGMLGVAGIELFRSTTRYCIVILCLSLLFAARRLSLISRNWSSPWPMLAPLLIGILGLWEFLPPNPGEDIATTTMVVDSDRTFAQTMEAALPKGGMVFQLPVMDFPENPIAGVSAYDHFRPYLYTKDLRYSFGSDKGRVDSAWQRVIVGMSPADQIAALERYGFSGIYINKNGYPDKAEALLEQYKEAGRDQVIPSQLDDVCCVILKPSPNPVLPPPGPLFSTGWFAEQDTPSGRIHLATGNGVVILTNPGTEPVDVYANFLIATVAPRLVTVQGAGASQSWRLTDQQHAQPASLRLTLAPGENRLTFTTDTPPTPPQMITFFLVNFDLGDSPRAEQ